MDWLMAGLIRADLILIGMLLAIRVNKELKKG